MVTIRGAFGSFFTASPLNTKLVLCLGLAGGLLCPTGRRLRAIVPLRYVGKLPCHELEAPRAKMATVSSTCIFLRPRFSNFSPLNLSFALLGFLNSFRRQNSANVNWTAWSPSPHGLLHCGTGLHGDETCYLVSEKFCYASDGSVPVKEGHYEQAFFAFAFRSA